MAVRLTIRWKLIGMVGVPLAVLSSAMLLWDYRQMRAEALVVAEDVLKELSKYYATRFDGEFSRIAQVARTSAATLETLPEYDEELLYDLARRNVEQDPLIYGSCIAFVEHGFDPSRRLFAPYVFRGPDGLAVTSRPAAITPPLLRMNIADAYDYTDGHCEWGRDLHSATAPYWTEPYFDEGAGNVLMVTFAAPFQRDGKLAGIVTVDVPLLALQGRVGPGEFGPEGGFAIFTHKGTIVSHSDPSLLLRNIRELATGTDREELIELSSDLTAGYEGVRRIADFGIAEWSFFFFAPIPSTGWSFAAGLPEERIMGSAFDFLRRRTIIMVAIDACIVFVVLLSAIRITQPIGRLAEAVRELGTGNLQARVEGVDRHDELGDLAGSFNSMVASLQENIAALTKETAAREAAEGELKVAREIQTSLLPRKFPPFPERTDFDLHAVNIPAKGVAGDFFDFFFVRDDLLMFTIADVSGKGTPAALFMAVTRTLLRQLARDGVAPGRLLVEANKILEQDNDGSMFVTIFLACYETRTGRVTYANAGHPSPVVLEPDGKVRSFGQTTGTVIGIFQDYVCEQASESLGPGESLMLYTDGATEARNTAKELLGEARLEALVATCAGTGARESCERITAGVMEYQGSELADDLTLLVLKRA